MSFKLELLLKLEILPTTRSLLKVVLPNTPKVPLISTLPLTSTFPVFILALVTSPFKLIKKPLPTLNGYAKLDVAIPVFPVKLEVPSTFILPSVSIFSPTSVALAILTKAKQRKRQTSI